MSYIDWGYYSSHFPKLTEEEFDAALAGAEVKVDAFPFTDSHRLQT